MARICVIASCQSPRCVEASLRAYQHGVVGAEDARGASVGDAADEAGMLAVEAAEERGDAVDAVALRVRDDIQTDVAQHHGGIREDAGEQVARLHQLHIDVLP